MSRQLPDEFVSRLRAEGLADVADALATTEPSLAVRVNRRRAVALPGGERVAWLPETGIYLNSRPLFAADPAWHQGLYYVQDASSMAMTRAVAHIVAEYFDGRPVRYLDACAAPGGKTIAALEALPAGSAVVANEADRRRADILLENLGKYGADNVAVTCRDAAALGAERSLAGAFDIVAIDAPCSGEGMMRKEPEAIRQWSPALIDACAREQQHIIDGLWPAVAPGGVLIYSTCTFNRAENEERLEALAALPDAEPIALPFSEAEGVSAGLATDLPCYRFMPGRVRGEGLFMCAVRKRTDGRGAAFKGKFGGKVDPEATAFARRHFLLDDHAVVATHSGTALVPQAHMSFFAAIDELRPLRCGLPLCQVKGRDVVAAWPTAYSSLLRRNSLPALELSREADMVNLSREAALAYLHGDSLSDIPANLPRGLALATHAHAPLGFIKNIGRRANNLYPTPLRLRLDPVQAAREAITPICTPL